jgi:hypothetical protein
MEMKEIRIFMLNVHLLYYPFKVSLIRLVNPKKITGVITLNSTLFSTPASGHFKETLCPPLSYFTEEL